MALTYQAAVEKTITAGEQIHQIVNGTATTEVTVEDGSKVPSIRKALIDNFYFKDPIPWQVGQTESVFNQIRQFTDGSWWYAPSATTATPVLMNVTPIGDPLWKIYDFDAIGKLSPQIRESLKRSYAEAGYNLVDGSFEDGGNVSSSFDVLLYELEGKAYSWGGSLPKTVVGESSPLTSGGISPSAWIDCSGNLLRTLLSDPNGVDLVGGAAKQTDIDEFTIDRGGKTSLISVVSITDFNGIDDFDGISGTNNKDSFASAVEYLNNNGGGVLRLPHTYTGVYFINGDDPTQVTSEIRLDPEPGVSIRLIYSGGAANSPLVNTALQTTRQLPIYFQNFGFTSFIGANVTRQLGETLPTLHNADGVYALPESLAGSAFKIIELGSPNTAIAPVSSSSDAIVFAGAGVARAAITPIAAGDECLALISAPSGGVFLAGVITANGYAYVAQNSGDQAVKLVEGTTGLPNVLQDIPYAHTLNQQRDNFNNALVSVRVTSSRSFSVLVNGLVVYSYNTRSSILAAAFGTENINDNISVSQMSRVRQGRTTGGAKALKILMLGDSITDNAVQYSHAKYLQMLLGSAGISVAEINNLAVGGQTAAQQYAILQTIGAGYDIACIQVGVNDAQGGTNFASFASTISDIVNYCKGIGAAPIVAPPTAFYSRAEAIANGQPGGQNTANNDTVHTYRAILIRAVASAGGFLNMETMKGFGAMSAKWLSIAPYSVSDRIVVDNIHPSPYGSMMLAQGWARSIIGWLNRPDSTKAEAFEVISSSWLSSGFGLIDKPTIRSREFKGVLSLHAVNNNDGAVALVLPPACRIDAVRIIPAVALNSSYLPVGTCSMYVGTNGNVYFFNLPAGTAKIQLDNILL